MTKTTLKSTDKPRTLPFVILGLIVLAVAIFTVIRWVSQVEPKKPRPVVEKRPFVKLQTVTLSDNQATFSAGGFVRAKYNSHIAAEVNGTVLSISPEFAVGNRVQKGDMLARIDDKNYVAAVASAKANLATAKSHYAQEQAKSRQAGHDAKRLAVKSSDLLLRKPQIAAAKAAIANAEAQLKLARQNLAKTTVKAPFDAIIQVRNISPGDSVGVNTVIAQLMGIKTFTVKLTVDSSLFNLLGIGDSVTLHNPDTGISYTAAISRFDPALDKTTRTVGVYVDIANPLAGEKPLLLNTYLYADIVGKTLADTMWIDNHSSVENQFVWLKRDDNTLAKAPFTLFYRGAEQSLVRFNKPISHFISNPKDSFFAGEKVTSEALKPHLSKDNIENKE